MSSFRALLSSLGLAVNPNFWFARTLSARPQCDRSVAFRLEFYRLQPIAFLTVHARKVQIALAARSVTIYESNGFDMTSSTRVCSTLTMSALLLLLSAYPIIADNAKCSCGGKSCACIMDSCGKDGAQRCGCAGIDCDCTTSRCPKFAVVSDCTGFTACKSDSKRHCNNHSCPNQ